MQNLDPLSQLSKLIYLLTEDPKHFIHSGKKKVGYQTSELGILTSLRARVRSVVRQRPKKILSYQVENLKAIRLT